MVACLLDSTLDDMRPLFENLMDNLPICVCIILSYAEALVATDTSKQRSLTALHNVLGLTTLGMQHTTHDI